MPTSKPQMPAELRDYFNKLDSITKKNNPLEPLRDRDGIRHLPEGTHPSVRSALRDYNDAVENGTEVNSKSTKNHVHQRKAETEKQSKTKNSIKERDAPRANNNQNKLSISSLLV